MKEECLICSAPLKYLEKETLMECAICHKKEESKTYVLEAWKCLHDCEACGKCRIYFLLKS